jgi:hypothetical protein
LEKLKENIILLTTTEKSTASNSSDMTRNIDNESVQKEFEELKNKAKK